MKRIFTCFLLILFVSFSSCESDSSNSINEDDKQPIEKVTPVLAGYLPIYGVSRFDSKALHALDILYYFSIFPDELGDLSVSDDRINQITELKSKIDNSKTKLFVVIGGWAMSKNIYPMAKSTTKRENFVSQVVEFVKNNQLDGVDLDWEAFSGAVPEDDYINLVKELSVALRAENKMFSVAVGVQHAMRSMKIHSYVDYINIMSYGKIDSNKNQVAFSTFKRYIKGFTNLNIPASKLIPGVPFYGKRINGDKSKPGAILYSKIVESAPLFSQNTYDVYAFNGCDLIKEKTEYVKNNNIGGIMAWELSQDTEYSSEYSLLKTMSDNLNK